MNRIDRIGILSGKLAPENDAIDAVRKLTFVHQPRRPALFPIEGYHLADAAKYRELLNPPAQGETKLDQVLRWARKALEQRKEENP